MLVEFLFLTSADGSYQHKTEELVIYGMIKCVLSFILSIQELQAKIGFLQFFLITFIPIRRITFRNCSCYFNTVLELTNVQVLQYN